MRPVRTCAARCQYLKARAPKVGVTGFCMGGALTLLSVVERSRSRRRRGAGTASRRSNTSTRPRSRLPLLGHFAIDDVPFPIATVDKLEEKLRGAKVKFEFHRYKAQHAFANETAVGANKLPITEYNAEAAKLAWSRTIDFLARHLK